MTSDADKDVKSCSVKSCNRVHHAKGYCDAHYRRHLSGREIESPFQAQGEWTAWRPNRDGYLLRSRRKDGRQEKQLQHRVVMEKIIGRPLLRHETVHHRNGLRTDNSPRNLELWSSSQPPGQRVEDKVNWAREILALYEDYSDLRLLVGA